MPEEQLEGDPQGDLEGIEETSMAAGASAEAAASADVEALHAELAQLRRQVDEHKVAAKARQHRARGWAVGLLIVLGLSCWLQPM